MKNFILDRQNSVNFSTSNIPATERFDFWVDKVCKQLINVDCKRFSTGTFNGVLRSVQFKNMSFTELHSEPQAFIRRKEHIARMKDDPLIFSIPLYKNPSRMINSTMFSASRGDISIFDGGREQSLLVSDNFEGLTLQIPKQLLEKYLPDSESYAEKIIPMQSGIGYLTSTYIQTLASQAGRVPEHLAETVRDHLLQLITMAIAELYTPKKTHYKEAVKKALLLQIKRYIESNLSDEALSPQSIAKEHAISTRYLHQLFEMEELTLSRYIIDRRLENSHKALANSDLSSHSITEIALSFGFNDVSHFCKTFKKKYHVTPREFRLSQAECNSTNH